MQIDYGNYAGDLSINVAQSILTELEVDYFYEIAIKFF